MICCDKETFNKLVSIYIGQSFIKSPLPWVTSRDWLFSHSSGAILVATFSENEERKERGRGETEREKGKERKMKVFVWIVVFYERMSSSILWKNRYHHDIDYHYNMMIKIMLYRCL